MFPHGNEKQSDSRVSHLRQTRIRLSLNFILFHFVLLYMLHAHDDSISTLSSSLPLCLAILFYHIHILFHRLLCFLFLSLSISVTSISPPNCFHHHHQSETSSFSILLFADQLQVLTFQLVKVTLN